MPLVGTSPSHVFLLSDKSTRGLALTNEGGGEWHLALAMVVRTVIYAVIMALLLGVVALVAKLVASCEEEQRVTPRERAASETSRLLPKEADSDNYGTCTEEDDLEVGTCSSSNGSSEDLYDGKICVVCYDEQRNCFFIPCGHCATCYVCARRIKDEESKTCPVCRRYIRKIKKLFIY